MPLELEPQEKTSNRATLPAASSTTVSIFTHSIEIVLLLSVDRSGERYSVYARLCHYQQLSIYPSEIDQDFRVCGEFRPEERWSCCCEVLCPWYV